MGPSRGIATRPLCWANAEFGLALVEETAALLDLHLVGPFDDDASTSAFAPPKVGICLA